MSATGLSQTAQCWRHVSSQHDFALFYVAGLIARPASMPGSRKAGSTCEELGLHVTMCQGNRIQSPGAVNVFKIYFFCIDFRV